MAIQRIFIGHQRPALPAVADLLLTRVGTRCGRSLTEPPAGSETLAERGLAERGLTRHATNSLADLRHVTVVVPGSRAGRRLLELLVEVSQNRGQCLTPPLIVTVGRLPEQLYRPKWPFATELVQRLAWVDALSNASADVLDVVIPHAPSTKDPAAWMTFADLLRRQHVELAADGLNFGDVVTRGSQLDGFTEQRRWRALEQLQQAYLNRLDRLELWDIQTARLEAVKRRECQTDRDIVLVGAVDLNVTMRRMLDQVADRVTTFIFAPPEWSDRFDEHGCLVPSAWEQIELPINTKTVEVVEGPADQAEAVVRGLASLAGRYRADEIVIGVPDKALIPDLERRLATSGVVARWGPGQPFVDTPPVRLLEAVASYLDHERYSEFAALIRHPDLAPEWERAKLPRDWLEQLDKFQNQRLPFRLSDESPESSPELNAFQQVGRAVRQLLGELVGQCGTPLRGVGAHAAERRATLDKWSAPIWRLLINVYGQRPLRNDVIGDRVVHIVCERLRDALQQQSLVPPAIMPQVSASQAIRWLLHEVQGDFIPASLTVNSLEMLGWLELPLDDAPVLFVTGFNEGFVPESLNSDLFMPNALRQRLGLLDNARRYARDAYAVSVLSTSHEDVRWVVGRRNHDGDPLTPSRLLFACDPETAVLRASQFFQPIQSHARRSQLAPSHPSDRRLEIPQPKPLAKPITGLRVTAFRDYLACPYRFYLKHVERLESISDSLDELDGGGFGSLAHEVMRRFGNGTSRHSTDAEVICTALENELDACATEMFGENPLPAVLVQVEQLRWRLRAFAEKQAAWAAQGWRIESVEKEVSGEQAARFDVDGEPFLLTGRIDRIDVHSTTGERAILDYKTGDAGRTPQETHQTRDDWIDLQLPLYRHLAKALGIKKSVKLGYILLPKDTSAIDFVLADWEQEQLADADERACEVVRSIRRQVFFPPSAPPQFDDEFGPICQSGVLDR